MELRWTDALEAFEKRLESPMEKRIFREILKIDRENIWPTYRNKKKSRKVSDVYEALVKKRILLDLKMFLERNK